MRRKTAQNMRKGIALLLSFVLLFSIMVPAGIGAEQVPYSDLSSVPEEVYDADPFPPTEEGSGEELPPPVEEEFELQILSETDSEYWIDYAAASFAGGSGTTDAPYQIAEGSQLAYLAQLVNSGAEDTVRGKAYAQEAYILTGDIDLSDHLWTAIGQNTEGLKFTGSFDGNHKTISGLKINETTDYIGLCGVIGANGLVKDLTLSGATASGKRYVGTVAGKIEASVVENVYLINESSVTATGADAGGLVGRAEGTFAINSCQVTDSKITASGGTGSSNIGGILGNAYGSGTISSCAVSGSQVETTGDYVGGICGNLRGGSTSNKYEPEIFRCSFISGSVKAGEGRYYAGGIAGGCSSYKQNAVRECYVDANISSGTAGGIIGYSTPAAKETIIAVDCYAKGTVTAADGSLAGGIVGSCTGGIIKNCYSTADVTSKYRTGGIVGQMYKAYSCVALNSSVIPEDTIYGFGRIFCRAASGGEAAQNYAFREMLVREGTKLIYAPSATRTQSAKDGEDVTYAQLAGDSFFTGLGWDSGVWKLEAGKLPTLKNLPVSVVQSDALPDYLSGSIDWTIKTFAYLTPAVTVHFGTTQENIGLPTELDVTLADNQAAVIPVAWTSAGYTAMPGVYPFTAVLPEDCTLAGGAALPVITVTVANEAPKAKTPVPTQIITGTGTESFDAAEIARDEDGDPLTITGIVTAPDAAVATAVLDSGTVTVTRVAPGATTVVVRVDDGAATLDVTVPITVANEAPVAKTPVPVQVVTDAGTGKTGSFDAAEIARDEDGDPLTIIGIVAAPAAAIATAALDSGTGTVTVTGVAPGETTAVVKVSDGADTVDVTVPVIVSANRAPTAKSPVPTQTIAGTGTKSFAAGEIAQDEDGDALTITGIVTAPDAGAATAALDSGSGTVTLTGVASGTTTVVVTVSDGAATVDVTVPITVSAGSWGDSAATSFAGGSGTSIDPYKIADGSQLAYLAQLVNSGTVDAVNDDGGKTYAQKAYVLTGNIDLSGHLWKPIGKNTEGLKFTGSFDGNNKTVSRLHVNETTDYQGLFGVVGEDGSVRNLTLSGATVSGKGYVGTVAGKIEAAVVENVHLINSAITATNQYVGGLSGYCNGAFLIDGCTVTDSSITSSSWDVGGILGYAFGPGKIFSCAVSNSRVETGGRYAGGICGHMKDGSGSQDGAEVSRCSFTGGTVKAAQREAGGIAGYCDSDKENAVYECYVDAEISAALTDAGGIVGSIGSTATSVVNCYSKGTVTTSTINAGGIAPGGTIKNCYSTATVHTGDLVGGIAVRSNVSSSVALNPAITAMEFSSYEMGRVLSKGTADSYTISQNSAFGEMRVFSGGKLLYVPSSARMGNLRDGKDITYAELAGGSSPFAAAPLNWDGNIWNMEAGKLPTLKNLPASVVQSDTLPDYLEESIDWTIKAFAYLTNSIEVNNGTAQENIGLPAQLEVTLADGNQPAVIPVTWSVPEGYDATPGVYPFTVVLPEDCVLRSGVELPVITVTVKDNYSVTFDARGGSLVDPVYVAGGGAITQPNDPVREGFIFSGWYKDPACTQAWNFAADTVTGSITLYAKWSIDGDPGYTAAQPGVQSMDVSGMGFNNTAILRVSHIDGYTTYAVVAEQRIDFWGPAGAYVIANSGMFMGPLRISAFDQNAGNTPQEKSYKGTGTAEDPYAMLGGFYTKDGSAGSGAPSVGATFRIWNLIAGYETEGKTDLGTPYSILIEDRNMSTGRLNASWFVDGSKLLPSDADGWFRSPGTYGVVLNPSDQIIADSFSAHALYSAAAYPERLAAATGALQAVRADGKRVLMYHTHTRDFPGPVTHKLDVSGYFNEGDTVHINYLLGAANRSLYHAAAIQSKIPVDYMMELEPIYIKNNTSAVVTDGYITFNLLNGGYFELVKAEDDKQETKYVAEFATDGGGDKLYPGTIYPQILAAGAKVAKPADPVKEGFVFDGWYTDEGRTSAYDFEALLTQHIILYAKWREDGGGGEEPGDTCTVTFATGNDPDTGNPNAAVPAQTVENGGQATEPGFFDSGYGYLVLGWYTDSVLTNRYDFTSPVTSDLTLYPKWMRFILKSDLKKDGGSGSEDDPYLAHLANSRQSKIAWKALNEIAGKSEWWKVYVTEDNKPDGDVGYAWVFNGADIRQCSLAHPYYTDVALTQKQEGVEAKFIWRTALEGKVDVKIDVSDYFNNGANVAVSYVEGSCDGLVAHDNVETGAWVDSMHHPASYYSGGAAVVKDGFVTLELTHGGAYLLEEIVPQFEARSADVTGMGFADASIVSVSYAGGYVTYAVVAEQRIDFWGPAGGEYVIADSGYVVGDKTVTSFDQNAGNTPQEKSYKGTGTGEDPYAMLGGFYTGDGSALAAAPSVSATFRIWNLMAGYDPDGKTDQGTPYSIMVEDRNTTTGRLNASFFVDGSKLLPSNADGWYRSPGTYGVALNPSDQIIAGSFKAHTLYQAADYPERLAAATSALQAVRGDGKRVLMFHPYTRDFAGPITHKLDVSNYFNEGDTVHINYLLGAANYSLYHAPAIRDQVLVDYMLALEPIYIKNNTSAVVSGGYITFDLLNGGYFELVKAEDDDREPKYAAEFAPDGGDKLYPGTIHPQVLAAGAKVAKPADPVKEDYIFDGWYTDQDCTVPFNFEEPLTQHIVLYANWKEDDGGGGGGGGTVPSYTVTFVTGNDPDSGEPNATIAAQKVKSGQTAKDPGFFDNGFGYLVLAWYTDSKLKNEYDFDNEVTADLTLYPKWMRYILKNDLRKDGGSGTENSPYRAHLANSRQSKIAWKALNEIAGRSEWWKVYVTEDNERNGAVRYAWVFNGKDIDTCDTAQPYYTDITLTEKSSDTVQAKFVWRTAIEGKVYVSINVSDYFAEGADAEISYVKGSCDGKVAHTDVESGEWVDSLHHPSVYYSGGTSKVKDGFVTLELTHGGTYLIKSTGVSSGGGSGSSTTSAPEEEKVSVYLTPEGEAKDGAATVAVTDTEIGGAVKSALEEKADEIVIAPKITGEAKHIRVELSKTAVQNMTGKTGAALTIKTDLGSVTVAHDTLAELAGKKGDRMIFMIGEIAEDTVKFEIRLNAQVMKDLKGVKVALPVAGAGDGTVAVLVKADGSEETIRKSLLDGDQLLALIGGSATVKISDRSKSFKDVDDGFWGKKAVDFATSHELFTGVSEREFGPHGAMTRGMLVTVLHRLENTPAGGNAAFADVDKNSWYAQAVAWAAGNSLVSGTEKGFEPEGKITREQLAAMLYRYAQYVGLDTGLSGDITRFSDAGQISDWAGDAMNWAVGAGLMNGKGDNLLDPKGRATRAEVAAMAHRLIQKMVR